MQGKPFTVEDGEHCDCEFTMSLTKQDFVTDQEVRWCPGCGDYAILSAVQKVAPTLGIPKEKFVFVSGIGCSSRFPYYMNTYGFHTIHGRALTVATGLKSVRPDLSVWVITGDGDALSIGGNHLIHALRRNVNLNILMFNNQIYGLTKGQYSPTSEQGKRTKSTPFGSIDYPVNGLSLALAAEATFVARSIDVYGPHLQTVLKEAVAHEGSSFVEIYQNCNIFNDGAFKEFADRKVRSERLLELEDKKPMLFGEEHPRGIAFENGVPHVVDAQKNAAKVQVHDVKLPSASVAFALSRMSRPDFPVPIGVFRNIERPSYDKLLNEQMNEASERSGKADIEKLLKSGQTWKV